MSERRHGQIQDFGRPFLASCSPSEMSKVNRGWITILAVLAGLVLVGAIAALMARGELNRTVIVTVVVAMAYIAWMIVFFMVIDGWLCSLIGRLLGVSLKREFNRNQSVGYSGNRSLLDVLTISSWTVVGTSSLSLRFLVGLIRVTFTLLAATMPIALGLIFYFGVIARPMK